MRKRVFKDTLIATLSGYERAGHLTPKMRADFEMMYRRAATTEELQQVAGVVRDFIGGESGDARCDALLGEMKDNFDDPDDVDFKVASPWEPR